MVKWATAEPMPAGLGGQLGHKSLSWTGTDGRAGPRCVSSQRLGRTTSSRRCGEDDGFQTNWGEKHNGDKRLASRFAPHWWKLAVQFGNDGQQLGGRNQSAAASKHRSAMPSRDETEEAVAAPGLSWWLVQTESGFPSRYRKAATGRLRWNAGQGQPCTVPSYSRGIHRRFFA